MVKPQVVKVTTHKGDDIDMMIKIMYKHFAGFRNIQNLPHSTGSDDSL